MPKGVKFPEAYAKTGPGLGFSIHTDMSEYPVPGPALISGGTQATPQLLTFGKLSGSPPSAGDTASATAAPSAKPIASTKATATADATSTKPALTVVDPEPTESACEVEDDDDEEVVPTQTPQPSAAPSTLATSARPQPTAGAPDSNKEWAQCGGQGFSGTTGCAAGLECKVQNPYYSQCLKSSSNGNGKGNAAPAPQPTAVRPVGTNPRPTTGQPTRPQPTASYPAKPMPGNSEPPATAEPNAEKTYTIETFIQFLQKEAGAETASMIRRLVASLQ